MKVITLIISLLITISLGAKEVSLKEFDNVGIIKNNGMKVVKAMEIDGIYFVKVEKSGQTMDFFISKNKKVMIQGTGINTSDMSKVAFAIDPKLLLGKEDISFGTGKEILYVFSDPECPYCKKFDAKMQTLGKKYTFKLFMFPLSFHKNAVAMSQWVLSAKTNLEKARRLNAITNGSSEYKAAKVSEADKKKVAQIIEKNRALAGEMSVQGTPSVFDAKMNSVNWSQLQP